MKITIEKTIEEKVEVEIRDCPFCILRQTRSGALKIYKGMHYQVYCRQCAAKGPLASTLKNAVALWDNVSKAIEK